MLAFDKQRLRTSQLGKRGLPAYVGEWVLDELAPGTGELTAEDTAKVLRWTERYLPRPEEANAHQESPAQRGDRQGAHLCAGGCRAESQPPASAWPR
ncbi:MAG: hypothetical protein KatS3mg051_1259 [Anaerolineae bacterium]|nr:MAG: hypothetical protein KatS3mg051_1259 [Anaerolineae bacterium]